jgi:hypothetical protein
MILAMPLFVVVVGVIPGGSNVACVATTPTCSTTTREPAARSTTSRRSSSSPTSCRLPGTAEGRSAAAFPVVSVCRTW